MDSVYTAIINIEPGNAEKLYKVYKKFLEKDEKDLNSSISFETKVTKRLLLSECGLFFKCYKLNENEGLIRYAATGKWSKIDRNTLLTLLQNIGFECNFEVWNVLPELDRKNKDVVEDYANPRRGLKDFIKMAEAYMTQEEEFTGIVFIPMGNQHSVIGQMEVITNNVVDKIKVKELMDQVTTSVPINTDIDNLNMIPIDSEFIGYHNNRLKIVEKLGKINDHKIPRIVVLKSLSTGNQQKVKDVLNVINDYVKRNPLLFETSTSSELEAEKGNAEEYKVNKKLMQLLSSLTYEACEGEISRRFFEALSTNTEGLVCHFLEISDTYGVLVSNQVSQPIKSAEDVNIIPFRYTLTYSDSEHLHTYCRNCWQHKITGDNCIHVKIIKSVLAQKCSWLLENTLKFQLKQSNLLIFATNVVKVQTKRDCVSQLYAVSTEEKDFNFVKLEFKDNSKQIFCMAPFCRKSYQTKGSKLYCPHVALVLQFKDSSDSLESENEEIQMSDEDDDLDRMDDSSESEEDNVIKTEKLKSFDEKIGFSNGLYTFNCGSSYQSHEIPDVNYGSFINEISSGSKNYDSYSVYNRSICGFFKGEKIQCETSCSCSEKMEITDNYCAVYTSIGTAIYRLKFWQCSKCRQISNGNFPGLKATFISRYTAISFEVLYDYRNLSQRGGISYGNYVQTLDEKYRNIHSEQAFVSAVTFQEVYILFLVNRKVSYKTPCPECPTNKVEKVLFDGTRSGPKKVLLKDMTPIESPDEGGGNKMQFHDRYKRSLFYRNNEKINAESRAKAAKVKKLFQKLYDHCHGKLKDNVGILTLSEFDDAKTEVIDYCDLDELKDFLNLAFTHQPHIQQHHFIEFLQMFYQDHSIRSIFYGIEQLLDKVVDDILRGKDAPKANIFKLTVLRPSIGNIFKDEKIIKDQKQLFAKLLIALKVKKEVVHTDDMPLDTILHEKKPYNPLSGIAYCFTESGGQLRLLPEYEADKKKETSTGLSKRCKKNFDTVKKQKSRSMVMFGFCATHRWCLGLHICPNAEGRKDVFAPLIKYSAYPPSEVDYDFSCELDEYNTNREPHYFKETVHSLEPVHGIKHLCGSQYKLSSKYLETKESNLSLAEQFNAYTRTLRISGTYCGLHHYMILAQDVVHFWNVKLRTEYDKQKECLKNI